MSSSESNSIGGEEQKSESVAGDCDAVDDAVSTLDSCAKDDPSENTVIEGKEKKSEAVEGSQGSVVDPLATEIDGDLSCAISKPTEIPLIEGEEKKSGADQEMPVLMEDSVAAEIAGDQSCALTKSSENGLIEGEEKEGGGDGEMPVLVGDSVAAEIAGDPSCALNKSSENGLIEGEEKEGGGDRGNEVSVVDQSSCAIIGPSEIEEMHPTSPQISCAIEGEVKKTEQRLFPEHSTQDSFDSDEYSMLGSSDAKRQKLAHNNDDCKEPDQAAQIIMEEKLKMLNQAGGAYLKCFNETNRKLVKDKTTMYDALKKIKAEININKEVAASRRKEFDVARKEYDASCDKYTKLGHSINSAPYFKIVNDVEEARTWDRAALFHQMMSKETSESWTRRHLERCAISVRFLERFKPTTEEGVAKFYEVFQGIEKRSLPMYDDYIFLSIRDIKFIFATVKEAVDFREKLRRSNFNLIGVESIKWIDITKARNSLINENVFFITRQFSDEAQDKNDSLVTARNNGGVHNGRAEEGLDEMLRRLNNHNLTPPNGPKTPMKSWHTSDIQAPPLRKRKSDEMVYPISSSVSLQETSSALQQRNSAAVIPTSSPIQSRKEPQISIISTDDKWTEEGIKQHIRRLSKLIMDAAMEGKKKEDTAPIITEKRDLEQRLKVIEFCNGDVNEAKKIMDQSGSSV